MPGLASWAKPRRQESSGNATTAAPSGPSALTAGLDPVFRFLFAFSDGAALSAATCPFPWLVSTLQTCPVAEATLFADTQVRVMRVDESVSVLSLYLYLCLRTVLCFNAGVWVCGCVCVIVY